MLTFWDIEELCRRLITQPHGRRFVGLIWLRTKPLANILDLKSGRITAVEISEETMKDCRLTLTWRDKIPEAASKPPIDDDILF